MTGGPNDAPTPADPLVGMRESAVAVHELYLSYQTAGFSHDQAFHLVIAVIQASIQAAA